MSASNENRSPAKKAEIMAALRVKQPRERRHAHELPPWVKRAGYLHDACGQSWTNAAKKLGKKVGSLKPYIGSGGMKEYRAKLAEVLGDPAVAGRIAAAQHSGYWIEEMYVHYEACKRTGDLAEQGRVIRHAHKLAGLELPKQEAPTPTVYNLILQNSQVPMLTPTLPMGDSTAERVVNAEIIDE